MDRDFKKIKRYREQIIENIEFVINLLKKHNYSDLKGDEFREKLDLCIQEFKDLQLLYLYADPYNKEESSFEDWIIFKDSDFLGFDEGDDTVSSVLVNSGYVSLTEGSHYVNEFDNYVIKKLLKDASSLQDIEKVLNVYKKKKNEKYSFYHRTVLKDPNWEKYAQ